MLVTQGLGLHGLLLVSLFPRSILSASLKKHSEMNTKDEVKELQMPDLLRHKRSNDGTSKHVNEALYLSTSVYVYIQKGQDQHIRCPSLREGEVVSAVFWLKGRREVQIARFITVPGATNFILSDHYRMSDSHGLVIRNVTADDGDVYVCKGVAKNTGDIRVVRLPVTVLDKKFPRQDGLVSNQTLNVFRSEKRTIDCPAKLPTAQGTLDKATVYWSLDLGENDYTQIIGAVYSSGDVLVINSNHGNFDIAKNGSLAVGPVWVGKTRVWCHLSTEESGIVYGFVDVTREEDVISATTETLETTEYLEIATPAKTAHKVLHTGIPAPLVGETGRTSVMEIVVIVAVLIIMFIVIVWTVKHCRKSRFTWSLWRDRHFPECSTAQIKKEEVSRPRPPPSQAGFKPAEIQTDKSKNHSNRMRFFKTMDSANVMVVEITCIEKPRGQNVRSFQKDIPKVAFHQLQLPDIESGDDPAEEESFLPQRGDAEGKADLGDYNEEESLLSQRGDARVCDLVLPAAQRDPPAAHQDPPSAKQDPAAAQQVPPATQQDPPSAHQDQPSAQQDPPSAQQDPPTSHEDPPATHEDLPATHEDRRDALT